MKSVSGRDKHVSGGVWCQGRKVIAVETSAGRGCAGKYLITGSPEVKNRV